MYKFKIILSMTMTALCFTVVDAQTGKTESKAVANTTVYQCQMRCEGDKTYDKKGKCPVCNMSLQVKKIPVAITQYQCPMKCEGDKTYDKAGKCPVCNRKLKAMPSPVAKVQYQCPMKCEGDKTYSKEGKCPVCNMALKKVKTEKVNESQDGHNHN